MYFGVQLMDFWKMFLDENRLEFKQFHFEQREFQLDISLIHPPIKS